MDFGEALKELKDGNRVAREGWNGKDMFIYLSKGRKIEHEDLVPGIEEILPEKDVYKINPRIDMKAADGSIVIGWLASQTDMLAEDWVVVE